MGGEGGAEAAGRPTPDSYPHRGRWGVPSRGSAHATAPARRAAGGGGAASGGGDD